MINVTLIDALLKKRGKNERCIIFFSSKER